MWVVGGRVVAVVCGSRRGCVVIGLLVLVCVGGPGGRSEGNWRCHEYKGAGARVRRGKGWGKVGGLWWRVFGGVMFLAGRRQAIGGSRFIAMVMGWQ